VREFFEKWLSKSMDVMDGSEILQLSEAQVRGPQSVIVVGGGLAGIAAAMALSKRGVQVRLLEAKRRLGGRVGSFLDVQSGEAVDYCQHVGMGCCANLKRLIDWLGQTQYWDVHRQLHFYGPDGRYQRLSALPWVPAPLHIGSWLWRWPGLSLGDRVAVARGILAIGRLKISPLTDNMQAEVWLREHHQTPGALECFWRTIVVSALGEELNRVNLSSVAKVLQDGFLNHRDAFHLLVPNKPLGELFGAMAEEKLRECGVQLYLQNRVHGVVQVSRDRFAIQIASGQQWEADAVIIAVPWFRLKDVFEDVTHSEVQRLVGQADRLAPSPISGVHTWWDRPWLKTPHAAIVGRLCQWVFPKVSPAGEGREEGGSPNREHYYQIVISASRQLPRGDSDLAARQIQADLAAVFPAVAEAKLLRWQTVTDPNAVFSLTTEAAGLRPDCRIGSTNLWLAGDWVQTGWPATMEGAILSGWQAAEEVIRSGE
jgi:squalene-associated FAD-dependent desaturase